jgi:hypothetical protein
MASLVASPLPLSPLSVARSLSAVAACEPLPCLRPVAFVARTHAAPFKTAKGHVAHATTHEQTGRDGR